MKIRETWQKQNNSVKVLMKKLKMHDTVIVAIAVVIALVLCGGLIYLSTPMVTANAKEELENREKADNETTIEKLDELHDYLAGLDQTITDSQDSMREYYENNNTEVTETTDNTEVFTNTVNDRVTVLKEDLDSVHETINSTQTYIENLKETIENTSETNTREVTERFTEINNQLVEIEKQYNSVEDQTQSLISDLKKEMESENTTLTMEMKEEYNTLIENLSESEERYSEMNTLAMDEYKSSLDDLSRQMTDRLDVLSSDMNTEMDNLGKDITSGFEEQSSNVAEMSRSLNDRMDGIDSSFQENLNGFEDYIGAELDSVNGKLDQVFQSVSDGKKLLASSLLTKNVVIPEDATFEEIGKAIESIPVQIVLDNGQVAGSIEYEYHFHVDGYNDEINASSVDTERRGGCYTAPVYHIHNDECYSISYSYTYGTNQDVVILYRDRVDDINRTWYRYRCNYCGYEFTGTNGWHHETSSDPDAVNRRGGIMVSTNQRRTLICDKSEDYVEGYRADCGYVNGQVLSAKIVFDDNYHRTLPEQFDDPFEEPSEYQTIVDDTDETTIDTWDEFPDDVYGSPTEGEIKEDEEDEP